MLFAESFLFRVVNVALLIPMLSCNLTVQLSAAEDEMAVGINELPMPAYGGHYSVLSSLLPPTTQPVLSFSR